VKERLGPFLKRSRPENPIGGSQKRLAGEGKKGSLGEKGLTGGNKGEDICMRK